MLHPELPQNIEAERATLGALLANRDAIVLVASWLTPAMFYLDRHGHIYAAIHSCYSRHIPPDLRTVMDELKRRGQVEAVGGLEYLTGLTDAVPTSYHVEYYAREVERCAVLRGLVDAAGKIAKIGYDAGQDIDQAIGSAQQALASVAGRAGREGLIPLAELIEREYQRLDRAASEDVALGTKTGFVDLDSLTGGLQDQDLILLAARPSTGKSALMACLARGVATVGERDALIFSLEMSADQLTQRMVAMASGVDSSRIRSLHFSDHDSEAFLSTLPTVAGHPIAIDDTPAVSVAYVRNAAYRHMAAHDGRQVVIFVDYLQLMTAAGEHLDNRVQAVSAISRDLKALAKELRCPVVALSQLSRALEARTSKIPLLSDLRESGSLEQDADIVLMLHREEMYERDTDKKGIAELYIAKHRNGPLGVVPMRFNANTTRFDSLSNPMGGPPWQP